MQHRAGSLRPDRVDLVDEDDARGASLCSSEKVPDPPGTLAHQDFVELGTGSVEEGNSGLTSDSPSEKSLASARWSNKEAALGKFAAESAEFFLKKCNQVSISVKTG